MNMNLTHDKLVRIAEILEQGSYETVAAELESMDQLDVVTVCHFVAAWIDPPCCLEILNRLRVCMGGKKDLV